jgi:hypothetical protein
VRLPLDGGRRDGRRGGKGRTIFYFIRREKAGGRIRRADAAQEVLGHVGFVAVDGAFECSVTIAARRIVSERW